MRFRQLLHAPTQGRLATRRLLIGTSCAMAFTALMLALRGTTMTPLVIFSAVRGTVLLAGRPVAGAVVEREFRWSWTDESGTDRSMTAADGSFNLPAIERRSLLGSWLPHEPAVRQTIRIMHDGTTHMAWSFDKGNYTRDGELGRPIVMTCHLETEPTRRGDVYGICELH